MGKPEPNPLQYIQRIDYDKNHGWWVRVGQRRKDGISCLFSDGVYGGKAEALASAKAFRDDVVQIVKPEIRQKSKCWGEGVSLEMGQYKGKTFFTWRAYWPVAGKRPKSRSFSCRKYGWEEAKSLAKAHRKAMISKTP